ncbi:MAG TPA: hypothetical protein VLF39_00800 [Candidatus Saccharimonadales bacterium]|nr:hypothetical protein [Candidatus Saccharimonadales bacterium]
MELPNYFIEESDNRLESAGFNEQRLPDFQIPEIQHADNGPNQLVSYQVFGDRGAPNLIVESTTFFTYLKNEHESVRLLSKRQVLGPNFAIVAIDSYDPAEKFSHAERKEIAHGSFAPLSQRELAVLDQLNPGADQNIYSYGYSMAADVAVQLANDSQFNPNRGTHDIKAVGAIEMARSVDRSMLAVMGAMNSSGKRLPENIMDSRMPALEEAWGIDGQDKYKKAVKGQVNSSVIKYILAGPANNIAMGRGFGTDTSTQQLTELLINKSMPVLVGRQRQSTVCPSEVFDRLSDYTDRADLTLLEEDNDHSADDNLRLAAARILYFASEVAA